MICIYVGLARAAACGRRIFLLHWDVQRLLHRERKVQKNPCCEFLCNPCWSSFSERALSFAIDLHFKDLFDCWGAKGGYGRRRYNCCLRWLFNDEARCEFLLADPCCSFLKSSLLFILQ